MRSTIKLGKEKSPERQSPLTTRTSKQGYRFEFDEDIWQLDGSVKMNLGTMRELNDVTKQGLRLTLCRYAEEFAAGTAYKVLKDFNYYCDCTGSGEITVKALTNWRATLDADNECRMGSLKSALLAWYEWGFPGVGSEVVQYLEELTLKGTVKGKPVKSWCPYSGPLTTIEQQALIEWASNAFLSRIINLKQYAYFLTLIFTGRRAVQIRSLRASDLSCRIDAKGHDFVVRFPRAKQKGQGFRGDFNPLSVLEDLYLVLENQMKASQSLVENSLGEKLPAAIRNEVPIFLEEDRVRGLKSIHDLVRCLNATPDFLHMTEKQAMDALHEVAVKNTAKSERTGEYINFTSRRFRYTKGTNLARRGITGVALAHALDHSDTQNIDVYTANTQEIAIQIDKIMAPVLAPLAQAFAGVLIDSERDALRANDPHSRIKNGKSNAVGNCGTNAFCASGYRACYTCMNFQPWREAPHEEVLNELLEERTRQSELEISPTVIQATDRLLLAVQQVILLCKEAKQVERENG